MGAVMDFISGLMGLKGLVIGVLALLVVAPIAYFVIKAIIKKRMIDAATEATKEESDKDHDKLVEENDKTEAQAKKDAAEVAADKAAAIKKLQEANNQD